MCPQCGAPLGEQARFCGQCGTTLAASAPPVTIPPTTEARNLVHEEETVARATPNLEAYERELAAIAGGSGAAKPGVPTSLGFEAIPTPIATEVPPEIAALARGDRGPTSPTPAAGRPAGDPSTLMKTMIDVSPFGASPDPAPPAARPKQAGGGLGKTLFLGANNAPEAPSAEPAADPRRPDASPLSRSVLAPQSWMPPAPNAPLPSSVTTTGNLQPAPILAATPETPVTAQMPAQVPPVAPAPAKTSAPAARTMLGMPATALPSVRAPEAPPPPPAAPPVGSASKTMLGVAIPGIAPTQGVTSTPAAAPTPAGSPPGAPEGGARQLPSKQGTLLGVAIPGIAPAGPAGGAQPSPQGAPHVHSGVPTAYGMGAVAPVALPAPPIVPPPPPLHDEPLPAGPALPAKRGVPAVAVVAIVMVLLAVAAIVIALTMRGSPALTAQPQLDDTGRESLRLECTTCPDGTIAKLGVSTATFTGTKTVLPLPVPLSIGENTLVIAIDRPASGRDEEVKIHVPVAYRVRADLGTLSGTPPSVTVRVEAVPGTQVQVEGKPLALDANGKGAYAIDVTSEVSGPSDESKTIERKIPFSITPKDGKAETGELLARVVVVPLRIDAPGPLLYTERSNAPFAGQTKPGATVMVEGSAAAVDAQGRFGVRAELPAPGERTFLVVSSAPPLAPRTARLRVVRVASLEAQAKELEAKGPVPFGVFSKDPAANVGKDGLVEGEVVRASTDPSHAVLLVEDKKTCSGAPCLARILHGEEIKVQPGDTVRAFGRVNGTVSAGGQTVPELDAALVLVVPRGARR